MFAVPDRPTARPALDPGVGLKKWIRRDAGCPMGRDLAAGRGSLLGEFHVGAKTVKTEHRAEPRHRHVECLTWVGWRIWRGFKMNDAVLIDLSRGGARVFLDSAPPQGGDLWLYLETPGEKAIIKARVCQAEVTSKGQCAIRVEFRTVCPYALFEAAVCGLHAANPKARLTLAPQLARPALRRRQSVVFG